MTNSEQRGSVRVEPGGKRVRAYLQGQLVADTLRPLLVWELPYYPTYYLPLDDVRAELIPTGEIHHSPSRGDGRIHDVTVGEATAKGAAQTFPESPIVELRGVLGETVEESGGQLVVAEDAVPLAEGEVGRDDGGGALVPGGEDVEEQLAAGLLEGNEAELVEQQERGAPKAVLKTREDAWRRVPR